MHSVSVTQRSTQAVLLFLLLLDASHTMLHGAAAAAAAVAAPSPPQPTTAPEAAAVPAAALTGHLQPSPSTVCKLIIQGSSEARPLEVNADSGQLHLQASLSCSGPPITVAAHAALADSLNKTAKGIIWDPQNCENLGCLISICGGSSAVLKGPRVVGVWDQSLSAAVCVSGSSRLVVEGGTFSDLSTSQGAMLVLGTAKVTLQGTQVVNNSANGTMGMITMGGGLLVQEQGEVHITRSLFGGNRATGTMAALGAALAVQDKGRVRIVDSTFRDNAALALGDSVGYSSGGAIYAESRAVIEAHNTTFARNLANGTSLGSAGAINVMHNASLQLVDCTFAGNVAASPVTSAGGALIAMNSTAVNLTNTTFTSNAAYGGSVFGGGGAIFTANQAVIRVVGGRFVDNWANGSMVGTGGGIASFDSATLHMQGTSFDGNQVAAVSSVTGGGIALFNDSSLHLSDSDISNNYANSSTAPAAGGGVGLFDHASANITRCSITHNWVKGSGSAAGGGIFSQCIAGGGFSDANGKFSPCLDIDGSRSGTTLFVDESVFESNSVAAYELTGGFAGGGGVGAQGDGVVALRNTRFLNNHVAGISGTDGGAVYGSGAAVFLIQACQFTGNTAAGIKGYMTPSLISCGGAVAVQQASAMSVNASSFDSNFVDGVQTCGGAACAINNGTISIYSSRFVGNHAGGSLTCGGGVCASEGSLHVEGVAFEGNLASGLSTGGAACTSEASNATIVSSTFNSNRVGWAGGAVSICVSCTMAISQCKFINNTATDLENGCGGAISIGFEALQAGSASLTCSIDRSIFEHNSAMGRRGSGGAIYTANAVVSISNSAFVANVAQQGGGLGGSGVSWSVRNCTFSNHSVVGPGGAVFTLGGLNATILDSNISHNRGSEGGGLYAASSFGHTFQLSLLDTQVTHNEAQTGGGVFLRAGDTHIGPGTTINNNQASQQAGGVGWVGSCGSGDVCTSVLDISCGADVSGNKAAVAGGGLFVGQAFNTHLEVPSECAAEAVRNNSAAFGDADVFFVRSVCKPGEVSKGGWCDVCPPNMYGLDPQAGKCEICPDHAACLGGDVLLPDPGFWHSTNNSTQIHACPNPSACNHTLHTINARAPIDWQCSAGYQGRVCGSCRPGYGFTTPFKCGRCMPYDKTVALYATALMCLLAFLCYSSHATWRDNQQLRVAPKVSDTIKTLVLYVNYVLILSSVRVDWPKSLGILYTAAAWLLSSASGQVLSLDCILPTHGSLPLAILRQLVYLLVPLFMVACVLLIIVLFWDSHVVLTRCCRVRLRRVAFSTFVTAKVPTATLVSLYLFFPSLVRVAFSMFACLKLDVPGQQPFPEYAVATAQFGYWVQDMQQACYEGWHLPWSLGLGISCTLLFCAGLPAGMFWWLARNRSRLSDPAFQRHYGFLYADFRPECYWWEALVAARTVVLVCISVFASVVGAYYGVVMFVVAFHVSLALQLGFRPFAFVQMHRIQLAALSCLDLTACLTLTFFTLDVTSASPELSRYKEVAGAVMLAVHIVFICWCLWVMFAALPLQRLRVLAGSVLQRMCTHDRVGKVHRCCMWMMVGCCSCHTKQAPHHVLSDNGDHDVHTVLVPPSRGPTPECIPAAGKSGVAVNDGPCKGLKEEPTAPNAPTQDSCMLERRTELVSLKDQGMCKDEAC